MGFLAAIPGLASLSAVGAGAASAATAAGVASGAASGGVSGALSTLLGGLTGAASLASALNRPKPPALAPPPQLPTFAAGLRGGNPSLVGQSPLSALGGTVTGPFGNPSTGGKTLLGQ